MDLPVKASAFVELNAATANLTLNVAGGLQLETAVGKDVAVDAAADHGVLRYYVTGHFPSPPYDDGFPGPERSLDAALHPDRSVRLAIPDDLHTLSNQRDRGVVAGLFWFSHWCPLFLSWFLFSS